jgi:hypothetical protein
MPVTALHRSYGRSDSCPAALRLKVEHEHRLSRAGLPDSRNEPSDHPVSYHLQSHRVVCHLTRQRPTHPFVMVLGFACSRKARQICRPKMSSSSYGLIVRLLLLSTSHRCDAVTVGYRPEKVYLRRTCTSLIHCALGRTAKVAAQLLGQRPAFNSNSMFEFS